MYYHLGEDSWCQIVVGEKNVWVSEMFFFGNSAFVATAVHPGSQVTLGPDIERVVD